MKKILLVNANTEKAPYPIPPLGLCLLSARLSENRDVSIYDCTFDDGARLAERVALFDPDYIGFSIRNIDNTVSVNTVYYVEDQIEKLIKPIRDITRAKIILGGSGFSIFPKELMELSQADYGIIGEAEEILNQLLNAIDKGQEVVPDGKLLVKGKREPLTQNSYENHSLWPDKYSEIDLKINFDPYREKGAYPIQTKRGCIHGCIYCTYPVIEGTSYRTREPKAIAEEIAQAYQRLGNIMFEFVDSTFNDPPGHAEEICKEIIRRKIRPRLRTMGINPRNSSSELFELMMEAGFVQVDVTPDSASPLMLRNLKKGFELREVQQMAETIKRFNLPTMWFFLFGGPGENEVTYKETVEFIDKYVNQADMVYMASGLRIYPETPLAEIALEEGVIESGRSLMYPPVFYYSKDISRERLLELIKETTSERVNCVHSAETRPSGKMLAAARELRNQENSDEPFFRTLLRVRRAWKEAGISE